MQGLTEDLLRASDTATEITVRTVQQIQWEQVLEIVDTQEKLLHSFLGSFQDEA